MIRRRTVLKILLPIMVLGVSVLAVGYLLATKPELERTPPTERERLISAVAVQVGDLQPEIAAYGDIVARRTAELRALVAGQVVEIGPDFVNGGFVRAGELLVAIDPFEYEAQVEEAAAYLAEARAVLAEIEAELRAEDAVLAEDRTQLEIAGREVARREDLVARDIAAAKTLDDALARRSEKARQVARTEQRGMVFRARVDRQKVAIERRAVALRRAERNLRNTRLEAPFDGYLREASAALGKRLGVNDRVVSLDDLGRLEARIHLSGSEYGRLVSSPGGLIGRPVIMVWRAGGRDFSFQGVVERVGGAFDAASGGVAVYASIADAGPGGPLRPGAFIEARIPDRVYEGAVRLPETALVRGDTIYAVVGGRLEPRSVSLLARVGNDVVVGGEIADGERIATTRFPEIGPGVKVRVQ